LPTKRERKKEERKSFANVIARGRLEEQPLYDPLHYGRHITDVEACMENPSMKDCAEVLKENDGVQPPEPGHMDGPELTEEI